jgi:carbon monoxide dehydrogenase subunit G
LSPATGVECAASTRIARPATVRRILSTSFKGKGLMKFTGEIRVAAPKPAVFAKLKDARFFASCVEGVGDLHEIDETHYTATLETRIAYIKFKFAVAVELTKIDAPNEVVAKAEGTPMGLVGRLTATSGAVLHDEGGETVVTYEIDVALAGKLGSLGQSVLKSKAREMEKQFAGNLLAAFATNETRIAS